jgi:hypothetical protein
MIVMNLPPHITRNGYVVANCQRARSVLIAADATRNPWALIIPRG